MFRNRTSLLGIMGLAALLAASALSARTYEGTGGGAIPDSPFFGPRMYGSPRTVSFAVTGITSNITRVRVDIDLQHNELGNLECVLYAPGGALSIKLFECVGSASPFSGGSDANFISGGTYSFEDAASGNLWTTVAGQPSSYNVPFGSYRSSTSGGYFGATGTPTSMDAVFGGLTPAQANGMWTLSFRDGAFGGSGAVSAANLILGTDECMEVQRGALSIADGGFDDLGNGFPVGSGSDVTYAIENTGGASLILNNPAAITGTSNCSVSIITMPLANVAAHTGTSTVLRIVPQSPGTFSFTYSQLNSDPAPGKSPYTFTASGNAVGPEIQVRHDGNDLNNGDNLTIEEPLLGGTTGLMLALDIHNLGNANLTIIGVGALNHSNCASTFVATPATPVLPSARTYLTLDYSVSAGFGGWSFDVVIDCDDFTEAAYVVHVRGTRGLSGYYTVSTSGTPDFNDIGAAFDALEDFGVAGWVEMGVSGAFTSNAAYELGVDGSTFAAVRGLSPVRYVAFRAVGGTTPTITGAGASDAYGYNSQATLTIMSPFITLEGFDVSGGIDAGIQVFQHDGLYPANNFSLLRCRVHGVSNGPALFFGNGTVPSYNTDALVQNCFFYNCGAGNSVWSFFAKGVVTFMQIGPGFKFLNNTVLHNNGLGATSAAIHLNTPIVSPAVAVEQFRNNIIISTTSGAPCLLQIAGGEPASCDYNLYFFANGGTFHNLYADLAAWQAAGKDLNGLNVDPNLLSLAIGSENLHLPPLVALSPAINAGDPAQELNTDIDGESRPNGAGYDIGADESMINASPTLVVAPSSTFNPNSNFVLWTDPNGVLSNATLRANDVTPDPLTITVVFVGGPMGLTQPAGISMPAGGSGITALPYDLAWTGTAGAANASGEYTWRVILTDGVSTIDYDVHIAINNMAPTFVAAPGSTGLGFAGSPFTHLFYTGNGTAASLADISDANTAQTHSVTGVSQLAYPEGSTLTWAFSVLAGQLVATANTAPVAADIGDHDWLVTISDDGVPARAVAVWVRMTVLQGVAPAITSTPGLKVTAGTVYSYTITVTGTPAVNINVSGLPSWATYTPATRTISGMPVKADVGTTGLIVVTASNGVTPDAVQTFSIAVLERGGSAEDHGCTTGDSGFSWLLLAALMGVAGLAARRRARA